MKRTALSLILLFLCALLAYPRYIGDVNNDGKVNISDVTQLVNIILGKATADDKHFVDVNGDGNVNISDVTQLVNIILGKATATNVPDSLYIYYTSDGATYTVPTGWVPYINITVDGGNVSVENTNTEEEYAMVLSGSCSDGSFTYKGSYKATIVLNGLSLTSQTGAALNIQCGKRIALELADNTENTLADTSSSSNSAALFCKGHMEISKGGSLTVTSNKKHAINCKEYILLKKTMGSLTVNGAVSDGIHVEQYFQMNGGTVSVSGVGSDGIQAELKGDNSEDDGKIIVKGGTLNVTVEGASSAALKSDSTLHITDGNITIVTRGDSDKALSSDGNIEINGGTIDITQSGSYIVETSMGDNGETVYDPSYVTGLNADSCIVITAGKLTINNTADGGRGMKADKDIDIQGGTLEINADGKGGILDIDNTSSTTPSKSYRLYVCLPTSSNQGGWNPGGQSQAWKNVYLYNSSGTRIATLSNQTSLSANGTTKTFYYYDFGEATSGTYYFQSDNYSSRGQSYTINSSSFSLSLAGEDAYYSISSSYSTSGSTRTYSISNVTSTWGSANTATEEGDTYKAFCVKADGNIFVTDGTLTLSHSGIISKGLRADGNIQIDGGSITDTANGIYMIIGTDPSYCTAIKCLNYVGNGGEIVLNAKGSASRGISTDGTLTINDGTYTITASGDGTTYTGNGGTEGVGSRGLKSDGDMTLAGGTITINSTSRGGKGIKIGTSSKASKFTIGKSGTTSAGPTLKVSTTGQSLSTNSSGGGGFPGGGGGGMNEGYIGSTKAVKCMGSITVNSGTIYLSTASNGAEGLESKSTITFNGGTFESNTYDDAINAASTITFNDGNVWAHASNNDAIDSNSASSSNGIVVNGGIIVATSTSSPEEAFDCDNAKFILNGGVLIGTGGSQGGGGGTSTAGAPTSATQPYAMVSSVSLTSGTYISVKNSSGTVLCSYKMPQSLSGNILVSHPNLSGSGTVVYNSTSISGGSNSLWNGVYTTGATLTGGTSKTITPATK